MGSPVLSDDFQPVSTATSLCEGFKRLLRLPGLLNQFFDWFLTDAGDLTDEAVATFAERLVPVGVIQLWGSSSLPSDKWLVCNGQAVSRTTYATLFSRYGTTWGSGDGSTTFNLPNLQDRIPMGAGGNVSLGNTAGERYKTLTAANLPSHTHSITLRAINVTGEDASVAGTVYASTDPTVSENSETTDATGSGNSIDILNPVAGVIFIIKVQ